MSNRAWVTLATNDSYSLGALVLGHSLRRAASAYPAVVLITPSVTEVMRERLRAVFAEVVVVDVLDSGDAAHLALLQRPELGITFTKIHCWGLTQYEKCVFLDADALIVQNSDELFEREELSAAPDVGWPDCFNSGVFVFKPSQETFDQLIKFAQERGSFDGGDQGLLNSFFSDWARGDINKHLPFLYNVTSAAFYSYLPALKHYGQNLKIIHFIGSTKPWLQQFNWESRSVDAPEHLREFLQLWWDLFVGQVHSQLDVSMVEVPEAPLALPPHDASYHYTPVMDPESEFPWHHPDAQIQENTQRPEIDLTQFHDPWEIYGGQIPFYKEDTSNQQILSGRMNDHEEMKKIAWEYQPSYKEHSSEPLAQESVTHHYYQQEQTYQHFDHSHQETHSQPHHTEYHWEAQSQHSHGHDHSSYSHHQYSQEHHQHHTQEHSQWHQEQHSSQEHHQYYEDQHHHDNRQEYSHQVHEPYPHDHHHTHSHLTHDQHVQHIHPQTLTEHLKTDFYHSHLEEKSDTAHSKHKHESYVNKIIPHVNTMERIQHVHIHHNEVQIEKNHEEEPLIANEINGDFSDSECDYHEDIRPRHPYDGFYLRHRATIDSYGRKVCTHEIPPTPTPSPSTDYESEDEAPFSLPEEIPLTNGHVEEQSGIAGNLARVVPGAVGAQREALDELTRRQGWEAGNIDYMGADSFENIWAKISQTLNQSTAPQPKQPSPPPKQPSPPKEVPVEVAQEASAIESVVAPAPVEAAPATVETVSAPLETAPVLPVEAPAAVPVETVPAAPVETVPAAPVETVPAAPVETVPAAPVETVPAAPVEIVPAALVESSPAAPVEAAAPVAAAAPVDAASPAEGTPAPATVEPLTAAGATALTEALAVTEAPPAPEPAKPAASEIVVPAPVEVPTPVEAAAEVKSEVPAAEIPATVVAASAPAVDPLEIPATVEACAPGEPAPAEAPSTQNAEASPEPPKVEPTKTEPALPPTPPASPKSPGASTPEIVPQVEPVLEVVEAAKEAVPVEAPKDPAPSPASPASPDAAKSGATPEKPSEAKVGSESPPLANTPSKDKAPALPAAKSEERRKGGCKLQLKPPAGADPLPTPDSEQEDAASLATSIIASELRTPTVSSPASPPAPASLTAAVQPQSLSVDEPELPTPPVGAVSLAQIGVKTPKPKASTAAQIESSAVQVDKPSEPTTPTDAPKKKIVKKVVKKDKEGASTADAPVPPPRKKEKKPKEK